MYEFYNLIFFTVWYLFFINGVLCFNVNVAYNTDNNYSNFIWLYNISLLFHDLCYTYKILNRIFVALLGLRPNMLFEVYHLSFQVLSLNSPEQTSFATFMRYFASALFRIS